MARKMLIADRSFPIRVNRGDRFECPEGRALILTKSGAAHYEDEADVPVEEPEAAPVVEDAPKPAKTSTKKPTKKSASRSKE